MAGLGLPSSYDLALTEQEKTDFGLPEDIKTNIQQVETRAKQRKKSLQDIPVNVTQDSSAPAGSIPFQADFFRSAQKYNVPVNVLMGLAQQESSFNPTALGTQTEWGRAKGLMQYLDSTAAGMGINPYNPTQSIDAAARQIRERLDKGYSMIDAVREHFAGPDRKRWGKKTQAYGNEVMQRAARFGNVAPVDGGTQPTQQTKQAPSAIDTLNANDPGRYRQLSATEAKRMQEAIDKGYDSFVPFAGAQPIKIDLPKNQLPKQEEDKGFWSDTGTLLLSGINSTAEASRELASRIPGVRNLVTAVDKIDEYFTGKNSQQLFDEARQKYDKQLTTGTQEARKKLWVVEPGDKLPDGTIAKSWDLGSAWKDPRAYYAGIVESVPEMVVTMGGSMTLARGAFTQALKAGATREIAAKKAATTATIAGGILEGGFGGAHAAVDVRKEINGMSADMLKNSDVMKSLMAEGKSFEQARRQIANDASTKAFILAGVGTGIFGGMGDRALAKVITEGSKTRLKSAVAGAVGEGLLEEMPQSALQQMGQNYAMQDADPNTPLMKGVANQAAGGAVLGGIMGGGLGAAGHRSSVTEAPEQAAADAAPVEQPQAAATPDAAVADPVVPPVRRGPIERSLQNALDAQVDAEISAVNSQPDMPSAAEQWLGEPGTVAQITPKQDPESVYTVTVEGYQNGEVFARDQEGSPMQFSQDEVNISQLQTPKADTAPAPELTAFDAPTEVQSNDVLPATERLDESNPAVSDREITDNAPAGTPQSDTQSTTSTPSSIDRPAANTSGDQSTTVKPSEPSLSDMTEAELRDRIKYLAQQAKTNGGWDKRLMNERRKVEAEIGRKGRENTPSIDDMISGSGQWDSMKPAQRIQAAKKAGISNDVAKDISNKAWGYLDQNSLEKLALSMRQVKPVETKAPKAEIQEAVEQPAPESLNGDAPASAPVEVNSGFAEKLINAHVNEPSAKPRIIQAEIERSGRPRSQVFADVTRIINEYEAGQTAPVNTPAEPTAPAKDKRDPSIGADGQPKWFMSQDKAQAFIDKKGISDSHEAVKVNNRRYEIRPKDQSSADQSVANVETSTNEATTTAQNQPENIQTEDKGNVAKAAEEPQPKAKAEPSANTLVTDDRAAELRARLKAKLNQLNSGIDPEMLAIGAELAVYHIERGARTFAAFAKNIAADLDVSMDKVRPYLRSWYNGARDMMEDMGGTIEGMDDAATVRAELAKLDAGESATATPSQAAAEQGVTTWTKMPDQKMWTGSNGMVITDETFDRNGDKITAFNIYRNQAEQAQGNYLATKETLKKAQAFADTVPTTNEGMTDVSSTEQRVEPDRGNTAATESVVSNPDGNATGTNDTGTGRAGTSPVSEQRAGQRDQQLSTDGTTSGRETGNQRVHQPNGEFEPTQRTSRDPERSGSRLDSEQGKSTERARTSAVVKDAHSAGTSELNQRLAAQRKAGKAPTKWGDKGSIDAALPLLLTEQRDDVYKAETRFDGNNGILFTNGTGTGKAQPLDAKVLTPSGWTTMGALQVGDEVIAVNGHPTKVLGVYPQGEKEIYRVTFDDGSSTECCDEHLWLTQTLYERRKASKNPDWNCAKPKVRSLAEIRETLDKRHFIPMVDPIQFQATVKDNLFPAYTMGVLLGDGCFAKHQLTFANPDLEISERVKSELHSSLDLVRHDYPDRCVAFSFNIAKREKVNGQFVRGNVGIELDRLGLSGKRSEDKFIPNEYLFACIEDRLALLQGLMDTDGYADGRGNSAYYTTASKQLCDDVVSLIQSLGGTAKVSTKTPTFSYKGEKKKGLLSYTITVVLPAGMNPFSLSRKAEKLVERTWGGVRRKIVAVDLVGTKPAQCIAVEHEDHLYVTDDYIVTHNTATGMGIAKRFINAGKDNVLIVVPSDKIAADWVKFAKMLDVDVKQLDGVADNGGTGPVVTTYANFGQNDSLAQRDWDLIIPDESHYLSSNENGDSTAALDQLRGLTGHHAGFYNWVRRRHADRWSKYEQASNALRDAQKNDQNYAQLEANEEQARKEWGDFERAEREKWESRWKDQQDLPKVAMLSATPFAYVKNTDYAEGYLFHYVEPADREKRQGEGSGYNSGNPRDQFMMQNFGYRMRYNKLTAPESGVNAQLLEQQFNEQLKKSGALSGRRLDVPFDYDRKFVLVNDAVGTKIDNALKYLREESLNAEKRARESNGEQGAMTEAEHWKELFTSVDKRFDYQNRMYLLESIKAKAAVPFIRQNLKLGRKVVVFHDFNQGGAMDPFKAAILSAKTPEQRAFNQRIMNQRADLFMLDLRDLQSPIDTLTKAFPDALLFNGTVTKGKRRANADRFNNDDGKNNLIIVQSDAGREGVSLHDTTGKHQRVEINLGMPTKPVAATQIEGRIYRTGQASDAIFRYLTTGTAWEASAFATKIAERASTAENLALGNEARGLKDAFIDAYQNADAYAPNAAEGKGGKDYDRNLSASNSVSAFEKSKTFYWAQQKNTKSRQSREGNDYYATPEPVGFKMVEFADIKPGEKVLEPSAGHGAIARFFPEQADATMIEPSYDLSQRAGLANGNARIINDQFESLHVNNKYDAIVMNPPYGNGGKISTDHLAKAATHLREGGRIVALLPRGGMADSRLNQFLNSEQAADLYQVARVNMPSSTFERAGTAVNTQIVVLEKHKNKADAAGIQQRNVDLSDAKTVNELFDRLENVSFDERKPSTTPEPTQDIIEHTNAFGNVIRGTILTGVKKYEAQEIDPYTFRKKTEDGKQGWFIREKYLSKIPKDQNFSRADAPATGSTRDQVRTALSDRFGSAAVDKLMKDGVLTIADTYTDPGVEGFTVGNRVTLVADALTPDAIIPTFLHELGGHVGMQGTMKPETYANLMQQFDRMVAAKDPLALEAKRLAEREVSPSTQQVEYLPYLITVAARADKQSAGIRNFINRIVSAVKAWAVDRLGMNIDLNARDVLALAERMVNAMSTTTMMNGAQRFSREDLKAPNGKPSNLTPEQWQQVRTPEFKAWFGDWENDPENASKVVDANGEPLVVYHGTRQKFTAFDPSKLSKNTGNDGHFGAGVYFSMEQAEAETYGSNIISAFLNIKNPVRNSVESLEPFAEQFGYNKEFQTVDKQWLANEIAKKDPNAGILAKLYADGYNFDNVWDEFTKRGGEYQSKINLDEIGDVFENIDSSIGYYSRQFIEDTVGEIPESKKVYGYETEPDILDITDRGNAGQAFTNTVKKAGHDGVIAGSEFVAFEPSQIKSATENVGTFDASNPDIRFSRRDDSSGPLPEKEYNKLLNQAVDRLTEIGTTSLEKGSMFIPFRPMMSELGKDIPATKEYLKYKDAMDAMRNKWHAKTDEVSQRWLKYRIKNMAENAKLMELMHESTLQQADPSKPFESLLSTRDRIALKDMPADHQNRKKLDEKAARDVDREAAHKLLQKQFNELSPEAKSIYELVRDTYTDLADAFDQTLLNNMEKAINVRIEKAERDYKREVERITDEGLEGEERQNAMRDAERRLKNAKTKIAWNRKARMTQLRQQFETNRLAGPYFPLARFGDYFVTVREKKSGKVVSFSKFKNQREQNKFADEVEKNQEYTVSKGFIGQSTSAKASVDPGFVADVEDILADLPNAESVKDEVWQRYLDSLPDFSVRKNRIHRLGRAGFNADAVRAFASHMFHGSHQLARMTYSMDLENTMDKAKDQVQESKDPVRNGILFGENGELSKHHAFIMNPTNSPWTQWVSSYAFIMYLGLNPAAAVMNLFQTPVMGTAILAAYDGSRLNSFARAGKQLTKAMVDFTWYGKGYAERSSRLTDDERKAMQEGYDIGIIDKTQGHELAGVAETGIEYSPVRERVMKVISAGFHHTERANREITFLAAYRMARDKGLNHNDAIEKAGDLVWKTHFDYSNTSRPRFMQSDVAKALFVFRNFQVNMIFRLWRDSHQALLGDSKEARREGFTHLSGITGMMMLNAGITGTWLFGIAMVMAGLFMDDGEDPEEELKKAMVDALGPSLAGVALYGVPGHLTGTSISERVGMPDLWFRSPTSESDMDDWKSYLQYYTFQTLGASFASLYNFAKGADQIDKGDTYRGIETMMPSMFKNPMKAYRYATDGVKNARGDTVTDVTLSDIVKQATGFTPARIAEQYKTNNASYNKQQSILKSRKGIMDDYYKAANSGDEAQLDQLYAKIDKFNEENPEQAITARSLSQSRKNRDKGAENAVGGMRYNNKLRQMLIDEQAPSIYK